MVPLHTPWCPCAVFYSSCFPSAWPGSCIMWPKPKCVSVQLRLFSQQSPGVLHSRPCQLRSEDTWRRAVLNECTLGTFCLTSCLFRSQATFTLNQDYFRILSKHLYGCLADEFEGAHVEAILHLLCGKSRAQVLILPVLPRRWYVVGINGIAETMLYGALFPFPSFSPCPSSFSFFSSFSFSSFPFPLPPAGKLSPQCERAEISLWQCRESGEEGTGESICLFCQWDNGAGETLGRI